MMLVAGCCTDDVAVGDDVVFKDQMAVCLQLALMEAATLMAMHPNRRCFLVYVRLVGVRALKEINEMVQPEVLSNDRRGRKTQSNWSIIFQMYRIEVRVHSGNNTEWIALLFLEISVLFHILSHFS